MARILYKNKHKFFEWVNITHKNCNSDDLLNGYLQELTDNYIRRNRKIFRLAKEDTWTGEAEEYYFSVDKITDDEDNTYIIIDLSWR